MPFLISDFGFAVGLRPTRRTVACGRLMASSFRRGLIRLSSRRRGRIIQLPPLNVAWVGGHSEFRILQVLLVAGTNLGNRKFCVGSED